jgi:hypothetical protein
VLQHGLPGRAPPRPALTVTPVLADHLLPHAPRAVGDHGTGLIGTTAAITVFLAFLLFAVQMLFSLYTRSVVTDAAYDGARLVAGNRTVAADAPPVDARARAEDRMRQQLGGAGRDMGFDWSQSDADTVVLRVQLDAPRFLSVDVAGPLATDHIDRTVHVRIERDR